MQKWKLLLGKIFSSKKVSKKPEKVAGTCRDCAYQCLGIKQIRNGKYESKVVCAYDKSVNPSTHSCSKFKQY